MRLLAAIGLFIVLCGLIFSSNAIATTYQPGTTPFTTFSQINGGTTKADSGVPNAVSWPGPDGILNWVGNHSSIDITFFDNGTTWVPGNLSTYQGAYWCLYQDGTQVGSCILGANDYTYTTTSGQWTGLDTTQNHTYELLNIGFDSQQDVDTQYYNLITQVIVTGGSGLVSQPAEKNLLIGCGDSLSYIKNGGAPDARSADYWLIARSLGLNEIHAGAAGATVAALAPPCAITFNNAFTDSPSLKKIAFMQGGANDIFAGTPQGSPGPGCSPSTTFECSMYNYIASVWANTTPPDIMIWRNIVPVANGTTYGTLQPGLSTYNGYQLDVVNYWNANNPTQQVCYIDATGWYPTSSTYIYTDHLHPTPAAYAVMAANEQPYVSNLLNGRGCSNAIYSSIVSGTVTRTGNVTIK